MKSKKKIIISIVMAATLIVSGAFAFLSAVSDTKNNIFKVGSSGAQLIETFDGTTYIGKTDAQDDGFANAIMTPGKTYEKTTQVKFTGSGTAYAYVKISVPNDTSDNLVEPSGKRVAETAKVVTPNFTADAITTDSNETNKWYKISEKLNNGYTEYVFGYTTKLKKGETTSSSPLESVTVANIFVNNNDFTSLKSEYLVPVVGYTIQVSKTDNTSLIETWNSTQYAK